MAKKKSNTPPEDFLLLPAPPSTLPIIDTHTHLASTFEAYRTRYPGGRYTDVHEFVKGIYEGRNVLGVVDVWCEAPVQRIWREFADAAWGKKDSGALDYRFVIGVHPHEARHYNDDVERDILEALSHPSNVGLGEIGLDYHYDLSPHDFQQDVFRRQLRHAIRLGKPLTIHTREAEGDTERILKEEVPREHKIHIHCFTDSPAFAQRLLDWFPNLYIGITGVITYATNRDTSAVIRNMVSSPSPSPGNPDANLRILLETDAPYMIPSNLYASITSLADVPGLKKGAKLPVCHSAMLPWTAEFVAGVANEAELALTSETRASISSEAQGVVENGGADALVANEAKAEREGEGEEKAVTWTADRVMRIARQNAQFIYGV